MTGNVVAAYVALSLMEIYFFLMQRSALELSRAHGISPKIGREMLPSWYLLTWPIKVLRWILLYLIWRDAGWMALLGAWAAVMLATSLLPIPHGHFRPIFRKRLSRNMLREHNANAPALMLALLHEEPLPQEAAARGDA